ncbi:interleukin-12 receptor subunit beta-2 [Rhineura floridana]|uniref:interleukin-12 receptor subunit beta-2 n=1 Tax=Rhineura floridana TaxID=261503 RepID=UPI002AC838B1|nr:interleukin-12 receptor subunit beta-2 [Rhineura floridana]
MFFTANVSLTIWLLVHTGAGVHVGSSVACISEQGGVNASGIEVLRGSTVTLSCWLNNGGSSSSLQNRQTLSIFQNHSAVSSGSGHSVSAHILQHTFGRQKFECQWISPWKMKGVLICGVYIYVGIPPVQPKKLLCIQHGKNGNTICTWDKGHYTYLTTTYTLQLTNRIINATTVLKEEKNLNFSYGSVDLRVTLDFESTYIVVVNAANGLGKASSQPIQFTLIDIVKPHVPVNLSVTFDSFAATNCTILWQDQQEVQHFRLRYQPINSTSWVMLENINTTRYDLHDLKPDTAYEFQVSCRFFPNRGFWSDWTTSFQTEAVPLQPIDVWYLKEDVSCKMQNITLFWKTMSIPEARRESHNYRVTFWALNQMHQRAAETHSTVQTIFSRVTPKTDYNITICSRNSRGISPPIYITTKLGITDLPPPYHLSAASMGNGRIFVAWEAPLALSPFINGYVVEWTELHRYSHLKTHPAWLKISLSNLTATIENLKPNRCYGISVFALYQNRAGKAASTTEDVSTTAPLTGPQINATVKEGHILVSWGEIPADQQVGCIGCFKLYMQKQFVTMPPKVYDIPKTASQPFSIGSVEPGAAYALWMTVSTKAGESPKGNEEVIYIKDALSWGPVITICIIIGLSVCVGCVPSIRQMLFSLLSVLLCGWHEKAIPDPANSSCAKEIISIKDEPSFDSTQFLKNPNSFEEPESLKIEEVFIKRQHWSFEDVHLFKHTEERESHNWPTDSHFQKENPIVNNVDYDPLITSTTDDAGQHQLLPLYRKVAPEEPNQGQVLSEYLANSHENATVDYLPTISPTIMDTGEDSSESELNSLLLFQRTSFLPQTFSFGGKLTLDTVQMDCNSFPD